MGKVSTLKKQKKSKGKSNKALVEHIPFKSEVLKDSELIIEVLLDCIKTGDLETFREVLYAHLLTVNKVKLAQEAGIGRRTLYDLIDPKKDFNPELSTVSAIIRALAA
jgi:DNA-binding phage protein